MGPAPRAFSLEDQRRFRRLPPPAGVSAP